MGIAAGMKDIVQDIVSSREARLAGEAARKSEAQQLRGVRVAEVKELKKEANEMLGSFKASHKKMGTQLRRELAQDKAKMGAEVKALRRELVDDKVKMGAEVKAMRSGFQSSHKEMSSALRKDLAQGEAARKSEAQQLRKELADYDREIESEVSGMRQETIADLMEARAAWQGLASTMKTGRAEILPKAGAPAANEETPDLEAKLLPVIQEYPEGITLSGIAGRLGVVPIVLARAVKHLISRRKIRKQDRLYFPASAK
jgi:hypothetical protein